MGEEGEFFWKQPSRGAKKPPGRFIRVKVRELVLGKTVASSSDEKGREVITQIDSRSGRRQISAPNPGRPGSKKENRPCSSGSAEPVIGGRKESKPAEGRETRFAKEKIAKTSDLARLQLEDRQRKASRSVSRGGGDCPTIGGIGTHT